MFLNSYKVTNGATLKLAVSTFQFEIDDSGPNNL
jgi:hypothetical protein